MKRLTFYCLLLALSAAPQLAPAEDDALLNGAAGRIAQHRQGPIRIQVLDATGQPVSDAAVSVQQQSHDFLFGCNIFLWGRAGSEPDEAAYRQQFADVFNFATLPFYWSSYEATRDQPEHERATNIARWCQDHGIRTKGHPLAWNYADPRWLPTDPEEILRLQLARIDDCVSRFQGLIDTWDVVNEIAQYDRASFRERAPKMTAMWQHVGQIDFPKRCFAAARAANPPATLLVNDYRTEEDYVQVIQQLTGPQDRRLYDVIGIQSHMHGGVWPSQKVWDTCQRFASFGVPLHFTELTILSGATGRGSRKPGDAWRSTEEGELQQAKEVERIYTLLFSHPAVAAITWWDFSDRNAWQQAPAGYLRQDMSPKPAYHRLKSLIRERWWTSVRSKSGPDGRLETRGFLGSYRVVVEHRGQHQVFDAVPLRRDKPLELTVTLRMPK